MRGSQMAGRGALGVVLSAFTLARRSAYRVVIRFDASSVSLGWMRCLAKWMYL